MRGAFRSPRLERAFLDETYRVRNYDISTALDVLTTGTYDRVPAVIKVRSNSTLFRVVTCRYRTGCIRHTYTTTRRDRQSDAQPSRRCHPTATCHQRGRPAGNALLPRRQVQQSNLHTPADAGQRTEEATLPSPIFSRLRSPSAATLKKTAGFFCIPTFRVRAAPLLCSQYHLELRTAGDNINFSEVMRQRVIELANAELAPQESLDPAQPDKPLHRLYVFLRALPMIRWRIDA